MKPITRLENFLAKIAGLDHTDLKPRTRLERFLAKIAGEQDNIVPRTRKEYFLNAIAENGGGGEMSMGSLDVQNLLPQNSVTIRSYSVDDGALCMDGRPVYRNTTVTVNAPLDGPDAGVEGLFLIYSDVEIDVGKEELDFVKLIPFEDLATEDQARYVYILFVRSQERQTSVRIMAYEEA